MPNKKAPNPQAEDDVLDLAWRLAPYLDFQGWELRGCPPRKHILVMIQEAREFVDSLCAFQQPNPAPGVGGREIVEEMLRNADLLVAATMTRANGKVSKLLKPEGKAQTKVKENKGEKEEPEVYNRYGLAGLAGSDYSRTDFLPHIMVVRMLDLGLAALERKAIEPDAEIRGFLNSARGLDRKVCKGVSCDLNAEAGPNRPQINPFISASSSDLKKWYTHFCQPLLGMMLGGPDPLNVRGRGNKSAITMLMSSVFWQAPGWVRFLKLKKGEDLDLWRYDEDEKQSQYDDPVESIPAWVNTDRLKHFRKELREYVKTAGTRITSATSEKPVDWVSLPPEAGPWLNDAGISSLEIKNKNFDADATRLDVTSLRWLSEWVTDFGLRYWWPVGVERCKALERRVDSEKLGGKAIVAQDQNLIADHRAWVTACSNAVVQAATLAGTKLCTASASLKGVGSKRADSGPLSILALESAKNGLISSTLDSEEVRKIRQGLHPKVDSKSMKEQAAAVLAGPEAAYRRLRLTFDLEDQASKLFAKWLEKQPTPKEQEEHLAQIRAEIEKLDSATASAGIELGLGQWARTKGAIEKRLRALRKAIPQYREKNPIALEDLDLLIAGADARVRSMEGLLKLSPKKRKASAW